MNRLKIGCAIVALLSLLAFSGGVLAARPSGAGGGGGGGGGGHNEPPDYGDLIILLRDADGVPIPSGGTQVVDPETDELVDVGLCWQPIAFNVEDPVACPEICQVKTTTPVTVSVNQFTCGVTTGCSGCTQEVDFGRTNEARSPDDVFEAQLEDVVIKLSTADCVTLDPAGRPVASTVVDDNTVLTSTIDSPLQNLAIYRQLMMTGDIGVDLPQDATKLDTAARALGVASDKAGELNVDQVAYLNSLMGLDVEETILDPKLCESYREEVQGEIELVEKCYLDYRKFDYDRSVNFSTEYQSLPNPAYIPDNDSYGWFEYSTLLATDPVDLYGDVMDPIMDAVFCTVIAEDFSCTEVDPGFQDGNIGGFAQAADDTRAVINFMHENQVLGEVTPVPCAADPSLIAYDVSISAVSGLQVPKMMVDGSEGRDFFLTVANAGPDPATGTVTVTATAANDVPIIGSPWSFEFNSFASGGTQQWTTFFTIDIGERTTIDWKAYAYAEHDVNPSNNTVTATTSVKVTSGGGGH